MLKYIKPIIAFSLFGGLFITNNHTISAQVNSTYLISFKVAIDYQLIQDNGGEILNVLQNMNTVVVKMPENKIIKVKESSKIEFVEKNQKIKSIPIYSSSSEVGLSQDSEATNAQRASTQDIPWGITAINATKAQKKGYTGKGIKIGIIDSGIDNKHEDLHVSGGVSFIESKTDYDDDYGHGTAVAGIIGAKNNNIGVIGVAPDAEIYSIKVLDSNGEGEISNVVSGIMWAINHRLNILNLSLETSEDSKILEKATKKAYNEGLLLVSAAGNQGFIENSTISFPAAYKDVIAVGATNSRGERTFYSNTGQQLELMAPGSSINSTSLNNSYSLNIGTSMSAAHVTGVAAQVWQNNHHLNNKDIRKILDRTSTEMGEKSLYGYGLVDAFKAVTYAEKKDKK